MNTPFNPRVSTAWRFFIFFIVASCLGMSASVGYVLPDSHYLFHEGEYVGLFRKIELFYKGLAAFPVLIHGAMDYIPSQWARFLYGEDRMIVGTRVINVLIVILSWSVLLEICWQMVKNKDKKKFITGFMAALLFLISPRLNSTALVFQQAFIGVRDLPILFVVLCAIFGSRSKGLLRRLVFSGFAAGFTALAVFWSYDRGVMAVAFLGIYIFGKCVQQKISEGLLTLGVLMGLLFLLDQSRVLGGLGENVSNIEYWINNGWEIFGNLYLHKPILWFLQFFFVAYTGLTLILMYKIRQSIPREDLFLILGLAFVQLILIKSIMNRAGMPRLTWGVWPSILLIGYAASNLPSGMMKLNVKLPEFKIPTVSKFLKIYVALFVLLTLSIMPSMLSYGEFIMNLVQPKLNTEVVPHDVKKTAEFIESRKSRCVFGWVNEGIVDVLSKKTFCTDYQYAVYVSKAYETVLLQQLKAEDPSEIVFEVEGKSMMNIDKRSMKSRLPLVDQYIRENYVSSKTIGRYTILMKDKNG